MFVFAVSLYDGTADMTILLDIVINYIVTRKSEFEAPIASAQPAVGP